MSVPEVVRHELEAARAAGVGFPAAWSAALGTAIPPAAPGRGAWMVALEQTRGVWADAYHGRPCGPRWAGVLAEAAEELAEA